MKVQTTEVEPTAIDKLSKHILLLSHLSEEKSYLDKIKRKKDLFDECKEYCEQFIEIKGLKALNEFNQGFTNHFKKSFLDKYRDSFPSIVSDAKMFEM